MLHAGLWFGVVCCGLSRLWFEPRSLIVDISGSGNAAVVDHHLEISKRVAVGGVVVQATRSAKAPEVIHHPPLPRGGRPQHVSVPCPFCHKHHHFALGVPTRAPTALNGTHGAGHRFVEHHEVRGRDVQSLFSNRGGHEDVRLTSPEGIDLCDLFLLRHPFSFTGF